MKYVRLAGTTDGSGDLTVNGTHAIYGGVYAVDVDLHNCDATADLTISTQNAEGAQTILTLTNSQANSVYYPRATNCDNTGATTTGIQNECPLAAGIPRIVVAQGGATKAVTVTIYYLEG